jgi:predicted phosphodiesterase
MTTTRIALVSDIHGNLPALQAVLDDIATRDVDRIVNLGDSLSGPLLPAETAQFLMQQDWLQLAGNHERQILEFEPGRGSESDRHAVSHMTPDMLSWIRSLPPDARIDGCVLLCHGTPTSDLQYFMESVDRHGARAATAAEVTERRGDADARVICCGHTHVPRMLRMADGALIVNPGSVGLQAYEDPHPYPHIAENGSPDARYAIVERREGKWQAMLIAVPYDFEPMAKLAESNGRPDWAIALRTGYMSS